MERIKVLLTLDIDIETGETICVDREVINDDIRNVIKKASKKTSSKTSSKPSNENSIPQLILEENKYTINQAAIELLGLNVDDENRLEIKYEKKGKTSIPVFGTNEIFGTKGGNKLTKSNTVACRGKANEELSKFGSVFTITAHPDKEGLFVLKDANNIIKEEEEDNEDLKGDENVQLSDDVVLDIPRDIEDEDLDLSGLIDEDDTNSTDDSFNFNL